MNDMTPPGTDLQINPALDIATLQADFRRDGHVRIERFLASGAPALYRHLCDTPDWVQLINHDGGAHELPLSKWTVPGSRRKAALARAIYARARDGFQHSFSALRIPPPNETSAYPLLPVPYQHFTLPPKRQAIYTFSLHTTH